MDSDQIDQQVFIDSDKPINDKQKLRQPLELLTNDQIKIYFENYYEYRETYAANHYCTKSLIQEEEKTYLKPIFEQMTKDKNFNPDMIRSYIDQNKKIQFLSKRQERGIASILGMAICDALGACTQFQCYDRQRNIIKEGFQDIWNAAFDKQKKKRIQMRHGEYDVWTDDASMGLAMAYSLILNKFQFNPVHIRYMFFLWLEHGLGNGGRDRSIGLGGNIYTSFKQFVKRQDEYVQEGDQFNNGNGSLMRLAPIPVAFYDDSEKAIDLSVKQSLTTHNGLEAKQCCRLMAEIIITLINRKDDLNWREVLQNVCNNFQSDVKEVQYLAQSKVQTNQMFKQKYFRYKKKFIDFNLTAQKDRNWNWKDENYTYSTKRTRIHPGYIGSYCMDALSMALHTVWHTKSFKECALMNANMGGDCDTVGSIAGQIAGAIYGIDENMLKLYSEMADFKHKRYEVFFVALELVKNKKQTQLQKSNESEGQKGQTIIKKVKRNENKIEEESQMEPYQKEIETSSTYIQSKSSIKPNTSSLLKRTHKKMQIEQPKKSYQNKFSENEDFLQNID